MLVQTQLDNKQAENRALVILKLLWKKFMKQRPLHRLVTLGVMLLTMVWIFVFYSTVVLWQIFSFLMTKIILRIIEWYLQRE